MCLPFLNLFVRYDALLRGWCVAYVGEVSVSNLLNNYQLKEVIAIGTEHLVFSRC
jgi:hypothetical protein